jgi:hypothetical protein
MLGPNVECGYSLCRRNDEKYVLRVTRVVQSPKAFPVTFFRRQDLFCERPEGRLRALKSTLSPLGHINRRALLHVDPLSTQNEYGTPERNSVFSPTAVRVASGQSC